MIVGRTLGGHHGRGFAILDEPRVGGRHFDSSSRFGLVSAALSVSHAAGAHFSLTPAVSA
jgi:hypothetical protein